MMWWLQQNVLTVLIVGLLSTNALTWGTTTFKCWRGSKEAAIEAKSEAAVEFKKILDSMDSESQKKLDKQMAANQKIEKRLTSELEKSRQRIKSVGELLRDQVKDIQPPAKVSAECVAHADQLNVRFERLRRLAAQFNSGNGITGNE